MEEAVERVVSVRGSVVAVAVVRAVGGGIVSVVGAGANSASMTRSRVFVGVRIPARSSLYVVGVSSVSMNMSKARLWIN